MPRGSYSEKIKDAEVMLSGIKSHKEALAPRGISDQYIEKFDNLTKTCVQTNNTQEKAKADLMDLTSQLDKSIAELEKEIQFCKRVVRTEINPSQWKEFGMQYRYGRQKPKEENPPEEKKDNLG
jgi:non-homologous end joining protein Ku